MKRKVWILPHTHYDAEVFMVERETLEIGYANLVGAFQLLRSNPSLKFALDQTCYIEPFLKTYPEEKSFLQQMVGEGRLEIVGGMHSMPSLSWRLGMMEQRFALPQRSPIPLMVPWT